MLSQAQHAAYRSAACEPRWSRVARQYDAFTAL